MIGRTGDVDTALSRRPLAGVDHAVRRSPRRTDGTFLRRLAGHVETGRTTMTDPAIGAH
jgi:hypothetical protein